ncbi:MAG TPA: hypothetical protein ENI08_02055 [Candidatus Dependentiae bacterium]|nr:hypothetical protein [Candidatus Dependentiae bacterium]
MEFVFYIVGYIALFLCIIIIFLASLGMAIPKDIRDLAKQMQEQDSELDKRDEQIRQIRNRKQNEDK